MLWAHRLAILAAFATPVVLALLLAIVTPTRFTATTVLLVQTSRESSGANDLTGFGGPSVVSVELLKVARAEVEILESPEVLREALRRAGPGAILRGESVQGPGLDRAVEAFRRSLRVEADPNSNVIRVVLSLPNRTPALDGLRALLDAYFDRRADVFADPGYRLLATEIERATDRLRQVDEQIRQIRSDNRILDITQDIGLAAATRQDLLQRESRLLEQRSQARAQLAAAETELARQPERVFSSSDTTNLALGDDTRSQFARLLQERAHLTQNYAPDFPGIRDIDNRIAAMRNAMRENARSAFSTLREVRNPTREALLSRVSTLRVDANSLGEQLEELQRQRAEAETRNTALLRAEQQLRELGRERDGLESLSRQLVTREAGNRIGEEARRQSRMGVQVVQDPSAPLSGRSGRLVILAGGIAFGTALAGALALAALLLRRTLLSNEEAERLLKLPMAARLPGGAEPVPPHALEDLVALLRDAREADPGRNFVQVAGTGADDGRSEAARALALALAEGATGDVALVELSADGAAHFRALGVEPPAPAQDPRNLLLYSVGRPNLWISLGAEGSDLASPRVSRSNAERVVEELRAAFEHVVVVAPPAGAYGLTRLAPLMDLALLAVRGGATRADEALHARDALAAAGMPPMGFVFAGKELALPPFLRRWR